MKESVPVGATSSLIDAFAATLPFELDAFQVEAIEKLESHHGVLVSAPTSAGKTVIADYAIFRALQTNTRAIYTTPLKALSNQKFHDYQRLHGETRVGLVTGENTINPLAPVVVMTTEVLRNLIYEDPERLELVGFVILDEIHYIDDFPRGAVWEEIIIQAPAHIKFIGLSATLSNVQEVADWMSAQRGDIPTVNVHKRPVELRLWLALRNDFYPLLDAAGSLHRETFARAQAESSADTRLAQLRHAPENDLLGVIDRLRRRDFLPAIYFIFSRRGCREALVRCAAHGFDLTNPAEKAAIDATVASRLDQIEDPDEAALYVSLLEGDTLRRGLAMHHAGLLPYLKEMVEELFQRGLVKVVFATETLSLGIHMPARAVVVSSFTKFDGQNFAPLTSGELTQLMGRAGRRGIDPIGHGIVLKESDVEIGTIYEAAISEEMTVESKFAPTYNMALNLLRFHTADEVDLLMERSFGQYQKQLARTGMRDRLAMLHQQFEDASAIRYQHPNEPCTERTMASWLHAEDEMSSLRARIGRLKREHWAKGRGRARGRSSGVRGLSNRAVDQLKDQLRGWQHRQQELPCKNCPFLTEHIAHHHHLRSLQQQLRISEQKVQESQGEYRRRMRALRAVLEELGFLEEAGPTAKGLLASRIYGENSLIVTQAIEDGWLSELAPAELAAALVTVTAEDRNRDRPHQQQRPPTGAVALAMKRLRVIYYRFAAREKDHDEENLRPLSGDYVNFTYDWCSGKPLGDLQMPPGVELGDAIKSLKGLYSALRQIEWAVTDRPPLRHLVRQARESCERDLITRV